MVDGEAFADAGAVAVTAPAARLRRRLNRHELLQLLPRRRRRRRRRMTETVGRSSRTICKIGQLLLDTYSTTIHYINIKVPRIFRTYIRTHVRQQMEHSSDK